MTYRRMCNRCGKEIGEGFQTDDNEIHFTKKRNSRWGYDDLFHLCNACLKDFDKFMIEKGSNKGRKE